MNTGEIAALRMQLVLGGFWPLPLNGKIPFLEEWPKLRASTADIRSWGIDRPDARNTGILTETTPTLDLDILNEEAVGACEERVREHYEEKGNILVRIGLPPKCAIPFRTDDPFEKITVNVIAPNGKTEKIEFLGSGQQVVVDGLHPDTGKPYAWFGGDPWHVKREDLPYIHPAEAQQLVNDLIDVLVQEFGYTRITTEEQAQTPAGDGDTAAASAAWSLAEDARVRSALSTIPANEKVLKEKLGDSHGAFVRIGMAIERLGWGERGFAIWRDWCSQARTEFDEKGLRTQWKSFQRNNGRRENPVTIGTVFHYAKQFGWKRMQASASINDAGEDKQDQTPLFDPWAEYTVPGFPLHILPGSLQAYVKAQSAVIGCDYSALAMAVLTAFSGAIHHGCALKMMRNGSWWVGPRIWTMLVGPPSSKKTPAIDAVTRPLEIYQNTLRIDYDTRMRDYEAAGGKDSDLEEPEAPERFVMWDTTVEKLGQILSRNKDHEGLLVKRDELSGWIGAMEKYSGGTRGAAADRGFWLKAFDGGHYSMDRIGRGETFIRNLSISLLGGIQPARLAEFEGLTSDGLLQRFIPLMQQVSTLPLDHVNEEEEGEYLRLTHKIIKRRPQRFSFDKPALEIMNDLRKYLHELEQASGGLAEGFQGFVGKLPGIAGSLALVLHIATIVERGDDADPHLARDVDRVPARIARHIDTLVRDFILPHAFEFYQTAEAASDRLKQIASFVLTTGKAKLTTRDLTRNVPSLRGKTVFKINELVSPLVAGGWLQPVERFPTNKAWTVSSLVVTQFAARRTIEDARKACVARLIGSPRRPVTNVDRGDGGGSVPFSTPDDVCHSGKPPTG